MQLYTPDTAVNCDSPPCPTFVYRIICRISLVGKPKNDRGHHGCGVADMMLKAVKAPCLVFTGKAANVWVKREDLSPRDLRKGAGIGIHADTLIGPVRLDLGVGEDNRYLVYFSAGFDF
jgi:hypothetical protein